MLHDQGKMTISVHKVVDDHDMGVIERRHDTGFGQETIANGAVRRKRWWQLLDGNGAIECLVATQVHDAHGTAAKLLSYLIVWKGRLQRACCRHVPLVSRRWIYR